MSGTLAPVISRQFCDDDGHPLAFGKLYAYGAGGSSDEPIYQDSLLTVEHEQPAVFDEAGRLTFFLSSTSYRFIVKDADDVEISDEDGIAAYQGAGASSGIDVQGTPGEDFAVNESAYLSDGSGGTIAGRWYRTDADDPLKSTLPSLVGFATAAMATGTPGFFRLIGSLDGFVGLTPGPYFVSGSVGAITAVAPANSRAVGFAASGTTLIIELSARWPDRLAGLDVVEGLLTLETGVPVSVTDQTAKTTIYFTPYRGNRLALYDGASQWKLFQFSELSIALPAAANQLYDVFAYDNAGVVTLELLAWTNDTTRATALVQQNGVLVKTGATTRRYLGTCRTTAVAGQTENSMAKRLLWNYYHRIRLPLRVVEATDSWTYSTDTLRQARAQAANQLAVVVGVAEVPIEVMASAMWASDNAGDNASIAIGEDSTSVKVTGGIGPIVSTYIVNDVAALFASYRGFVPLGYHIYTWLERAGAGGTSTFFGDNGLSTVQAGIAGCLG